ncbi:MAG: UDP-N-acetylmuramoyl-L-alanine--D-glutamate ligase [Sandaracinaceae bacterium]
MTARVHRIQAGSRAVVVGAGASGLSAARLLRLQGAAVTVLDRRDAATLGERANEVRALGADLALQREEAFDGVDTIVLSPGVPPLEAVRRAAAAGAEVMGEVELAARLLTGTLIGITGTNGKSTVTTLVGDMLRRSGVPTFVGGNLGLALGHAVDSDADVAEGRVVAELSSFQLEEVSQLRPKVAALLNVSPDHLDRYDDLAHYARTKARIFDAQRPDDHAVLPDGDADVRALFGERTDGPQLHLFGGDAGEVRVEGDRLVDQGSEFTLPVAELRLAGRHNQSNAAAAVLIARLAGARVDAMRDALVEARGLSHRAERVRELNGVQYIDDSKATNVGAAVAALDGLASPARRAVLILGGVDKGGSYAPVVSRMSQVGRAVVVLGEASDLITRAFDGAGLPLARAESIEEAVSLSAGLAQAGDLVLLAPACSSFDMFRSYAHRGDAFQDAVRALPEGEAR